LSLAFVACTGIDRASAIGGDTKDSHGVAGSGSDADTKKVFDETVAPILETNCASCHTAGRAGPPFLEPIPDTHSAVVNREGLLDFANPPESLLVTRGAHSGPALSTQDASVITTWITLEAAIKKDGQSFIEISTNLVPLTPGKVTLDLSAVGLTGSSMTFEVSVASSLTYLDNWLVAAGTRGVTLVHPLIVTWFDQKATVDPIDRFSGVSIEVPAGERAKVGQGSAIFADVKPGSSLSIHFSKVAAYAGTGDGGSATSAGCKRVDLFTQFARGPLSQNCATCHSNGGARTVLDMSPINDQNTTAQALACRRIRGVANLTNKPASLLFSQPNPQVNNGHDFKFADQGALTTFRDAVMQWLQNE